MSFRNEVKIKIESEMEHRFYKWLSANNGEEIFKKRRVTSIYFDNDNLGCYSDSIEGTVPRKKIRLRTYNNYNFDSKLEIFLEKKISSIEGRYKTIEKITNLDEILKKGLIDSDYGLLKQKIKVDYFRNYYSCKKLRFTLDKSINYISVNSLKNSNKFEQNSVILELKSKDNFDIEKFFDENQFVKIRYSKYCNSIDKIFK